jgi:hypothetical protein
MSSDLDPRKFIRIKRSKFPNRGKDAKLSAKCEERGLSFSGRDWVALHDNFTYEHSYGIFLPAVGAFYLT